MSVMLVTPFWANAEFALKLQSLALSDQTQSVSVLRKSLVGVNTRVIRWLQEAAGAHALINQTTLASGAESRRTKKTGSYGCEGSSTYLNWGIAR
jgi:hypothetical protein